MAKHSMGSDFRRVSRVKGFEFRIWDHFDQIYLKNILKIVYLISCYGMLIDIKHLTFSIENQGWNNAMRDALMEGYLMKIDTEYIKFVSKQFKIKIDKIENNNNNKKMLSFIIDKIWDKVINNKKIKDIYLLMVGNDMKKPIIENINKMSQDYATN